MKHTQVYTMIIYQAFISWYYKIVVKIMKSTSCSVSDMSQNQIYVVKVISEKWFHSSKSRFLQDNIKDDC